MRIAGRDLVLGDIVLLAEGDRIPADLELIGVSALAVDESLLTGESVPVDKQAMGAMDGGTEWRRHTDPARTKRIVKQVALVGLAIATALALVYGLRTCDRLHGHLAGLTLAMAILPEELPVVLTIFLGLGAWRLTRENVLARSIPAIELLGATTVLCVDETGTLTANRMAVCQLWCPLACYDAVRNADAPLEEALHGVLEYAVLASHRRAFDPMETAISDAG